MTEGSSHEPAISMSPPPSESELGATSAWWRRVPLWVVWTLALTLLFGAVTFSVVGPVLVEVWAVQTLRGIKGVNVDPDHGIRDWGGPVVYALRHHLFKPQDHIIFFRPDAPGKLSPCSPGFVRSPLCSCTAKTCGTTTWRSSANCPGWASWF